MDWLTIVLIAFLALNAICWFLAIFVIKDASDWLSAIEHIMRDKHYSKGHCQVCGREYVRDTTDDFCDSCRSWRRL